MATKTRNEAAERLLDVLHAGCVRYHERISGMGLPLKPLHDKHDHDREAEELLPVLAAERRATAERIRRRLDLIPDRFMQVPEAGVAIHLIPRDDLFAILDEEASRRG